MLSKFIFVLLCCYVNSVISLSPFFERGQRAEIYELIDNEMPKVRVYMSEENFINLKNKANNVYSNISNSNNTTTEFDINDILYETKDLFSDIPKIMHEIKYNLKLYKKMNFKEIYPEYDINEIFPQLQVDKEGYAKYDIEEVFKGYDYNPEHYQDLNIENYDSLKKYIYESNKNFNLFEINNKLNDLKMAIDIIELYKMVGDISFESWEIKEFNKYNKNSAVEEVEETEERKGNNEKEDNIFNFKTKNATMIFELNGNKKPFNKINFSVGGQSSRYQPKPLYNLKIKEGKKLYGRKHFKLRSDMGDPTYLRTKLVSDIRNRLGIKSISTNYIQLYINNEFMGLYIISDVLNLPWIENVYGDRKSTLLYKCTSLNDFLPDFSYGCENKNEDATDDTEWLHLLKTIENAKSASDLEEIFDIEHFLYEMAIDYSLNALDHYSHNFYMYKQPNGKWTYLSYDFDRDLGLINNVYNMPYEDYFNIYNNKGRLYDLLIKQDPSRFNEILKDIVNRVVNPSTLYPHIDELKQFIKPYVVLDKTPSANGRYPGVLIDRPNFKYYSYEQWDTYSDYNDGNIDNEWSYEFGLKHLILMKYRYICNMYNMECDPIYI